MENTNKPEKELTGYPSIDKPWLKYYSEEAINAPLPECTVYENIYQHNKDYLNQTALEFFGEKISYKKMFKSVEMCAQALYVNGISKNSIVNVCSSAIPEITYLVLACGKIGAVANIINPLFNMQDKINRLNDTRSDTLFVMDKMYDYVKDVIDKTSITKIIIIPANNSLSALVKTLANIKDKRDAELSHAIKTGKYILWDDYIKSGRNHLAPATVQYEKDMPMIMVYSSGTTGASKGIVLTNNSINATISQYETAMFTEEKRGNKFLHSIPVWFSTGIVISMLMPICLGASCILEPIFSPESFLNDIVTYKPNYALVATGLWLYAIEHMGKEFDLSFLKCPITGGEQMLSSTEIYINNFLKKHGCNTQMQSGWGMCELGATAATTVFSKHTKLGSVGIPMPLAIISAFDVDSNEEKSYNERGELRVKTPCAMKGYFNRPESTKEFFKTDLNQNVWGCTGDIGYVDEDGFVYVLGRASDYFIDPDAVKHYLFDIENVILENESVDICEVITVDSKKYGREVPIAHLILSKNFNGDTNTLIETLDAKCKENLPRYAVPIGYKIRDSFAVKPNGKRDTTSIKSEIEGIFCVVDGIVTTVNVN